MNCVKLFMIFRRNCQSIQNYHSKIDSKSNENGSVVTKVVFQSTKDDTSNNNQNLYILFV